MSPEQEDTALEEALRDDLPSPETSTRLRRRLLAAGLAIGNGALATTTAAAAGAAPGLGAGLVGKGLALSWGVKLGALAVVAIPTVGLLVESQSEPQLAAPTASVLAPRRPARVAEVPNVLVAPEPVDGVAPAEPATPPPAAARTERASELGQAPAPRAEPLASGPSQVAFATPEAAPSKAASTLADETRLLDAAFAELAAGRSAPAAELLAEHQRRFPRGLLQKERERARARLAEISRGD
jgi:hypothetical protein